MLQNVACLFITHLLNGAEFFLKANSHSASQEIH